MKSFKKEYAFLLLSWLIFAIWGIVARKIDVPIPISLTIITFFGALVSWFFIKSRIAFNYKTLIVGVILVLDLLFLFLAFQRISFSTTIAIHYAGPVLVMLLSPIILKEKFSTTNLVYSIVGVLAIAILMYEESQLKGSEKAIVVGIIFACLSSLTLALNIIFQRLNMRTSGDFSGDYGLVVFQYNLYMFLIYSLVVSPIWFFARIEENFFEIKDLAEYFWLAIAGILTQGVAMLLFNSSIRNVESQTIAKLAFAEVLFVSVLGFIIYKEIPSILQMVGIFIIVLIVYRTTRD